MRDTRISLLLLLSLPLAASSWQDNSERPLQPPDVHVVLSIRDGQSTFHIGEVIRVELAFTSTSPKKYRIDEATYDRSGRLGEETWAVEPHAGVDDPLAVYFASLNGFIGGGLRGIETLSAEPVVIQAELNEWVRFKQPGRYRVTATSSRVSRLMSQFHRAINVTSNELELTLVPATATWQQRSLEQALAVLDRPAQPSVSPDQPNARRDAIKTLRYLGSEAAAREMARRMCGPDESFELMFGLVGSPAKDAALDAMKDLLAAPDFPVTNPFLLAMSVLALTPAASGLPAQREQLEAHFRQDLMSALSTKQGTALAVSAGTIVEATALRSHELSPDVKRKLTEVLVAGFDDLPVAMQQDLMESRWRALDPEAALPLLRKVAQRYEDFPELREMHAFQFNTAGAAALRHWYEIDAAGARPAILREIARPKPRFDGEALGMLPDQELPEMDRPLIEHLRESEDGQSVSNVASLIRRYATRAIEPEVAGYLGERRGKVPCATQASLLAYLIKQDPENASSCLTAAMAARDETGCFRSLFSEVGKLVSDPVLEQASVAAIDDTDPQVVSSAVAYLGEHGSAAAEEILWSRLSAWSQRWMGRETELRNGAIGSIYEANAGDTMMRALATGQSWLANEAKLRRLIQLSIGPQHRQEAENYLREWQTQPGNIQFIGLTAGRFQINIAQYQAASLEAAKGKLAQFPRGSVFCWSPSGQDGEEKAFRELSKFAADHGLKLTTNSE